MYRDRHEMFEGLLQNVHGAEFSASRLVGFLAGLVGFFLLPLVVLPLGRWGGSVPLIVMGAILWLALFGKHVAFSFAVGLRRLTGSSSPSRWRTTCGGSRSRWSEDGSVGR
ncbi:MAG: hypothetical protein WB789_01540 [Thermoplasmata archaeon]